MQNVLGKTVAGKTTARHVPKCMACSVYADRQPVILPVFYAAFPAGHNDFLSLLDKRVSCLAGFSE